MRQERLPNHHFSCQKFTYSVHDYNMYVDYTTPFQINYAPNLIDFMELIIMVTYKLSPDSCRVQQICSSPDHCMWINVRGEPVFSVIAASWFCEKSGQIGQVEDVKPVLAKQKWISIGNHFEEEDFHPDEL